MFDSIKEAYNEFNAETKAVSKGIGQAMAQGMVAAYKGTVELAFNAVGGPSIVKEAVEKQQNQAIARNLNAELTALPGTGLLYSTSPFPEKNLHVSPPNHHHQEHARLHSVKHVENTANRLESHALDAGATLKSFTVASTNAAFATPSSGLEAMPKSIHADGKMK